MKLSIIVPCFQEEKVLETTLNRIQNAIKDTFQDFEIICINDGSADATASILNTQASQNTHLKIIHFSRNFGHQAAVVAGLHACTGDVAAILDADLQDPPEIIAAMYEKMESQNANVIYGLRTTRAGETFFKKFTAKLFYKTMRYLSEQEIPLNTGDFRLIDRKVIDAFNKLEEKQKYIRGLIAWLGFKQLPYEYSRDARYAGETQYTLKKMLRLASHGIFYFSNKPLRIATSLGFISVAVSLLLTIYVFYIRKFYPEQIVPGWSSLLITIIFFGGIQLLTLGIIGEYIANIFNELKNRPEYIIEEKINF